MTHRILLTTINARYAHSALGLRYLKANMGDLQSCTDILEFTIQQHPEEIVERILTQQPTIIGLGVYIWNIGIATEVVRILHTLVPHIPIILGGPEVSYEYEGKEIVQHAHYLITGWGDISFPALCQQLVAGKKPLQKVIAGIQPPMEQITLPYDEYTDTDLQHRTIYVEASRGCPFTCEFCLSSLDKTAWNFPIEPFLASMDRLYQRGLRQFKFVDRTFNLNKKITTRILEFFLQKIKEQPDDGLFLHFELIPDHLPEVLKECLVQFPVGSLQFEIGIQTLHPPTQELISRKTKLDQAQSNIEWLKEHTYAHLHVDLIAGLPGENFSDFARGFDRLYQWKPHEIQLGILKRLKGTPIIRHTAAFDYRYNPCAPYEVLQNKDISYTEMNELKRIAKYWDWIGNSGRFPHTLPLILGEQAFAGLRACTQFLFSRTQKNHSVALDKLFQLIFEYLTTECGLPVAEVQSAMAADFLRTGIKGFPKYLGSKPEISPVSYAQHIPSRQARHLTPESE